MQLPPHSLLGDVKALMGSWKTERLGVCTEGFHACSAASPLPPAHKPTRKPPTATPASLAAPLRFLGARPTPRGLTHALEGPGDALVAVHACGGRTPELAVSSLRTRAASSLR